MTRRKLLGGGAAVAAGSGLSLASGGTAMAFAADGRPPAFDPTPVGKFMPPPFLSLPFAKADARGSLFATNLWHNSRDENGMTGLDIHAAIDYELVRTPGNGWGVPVRAMADGRAYFSYQYIGETWIDPKTQVTHQIGVGAGLVIEVRHAKDTPAQVGFVTQYIHVSGIISGMPYLPPTDVGGGDWSPAGLFQDNTTLWNFGMPVIRGQVIGYQGDTGIGFDWRDDFDPATGVVHPRDRRALKPWDPTQLHTQLYQGRVNGAKQNIIDPSGIWGQASPGEWYGPDTTEYNPHTPEPGLVQVGPRSAFLTDTHGRPLYAA